MTDARSALTPDAHQYRPELREDPGLHAILRILRRRWLAVVACMIAVPAIALALSLGTTREYTASASLLFRTLDLTPGNVQNTPLPPSTDPTREANTNLTLAELQTVAKRTADALGGGLTDEVVAKKVSVGAEGTSDVARVTATDTSPARAARIANTYASEYIAFRRASDQATLNRPIRLLQARISKLPRAERRSALGRSLEQRLNYLASVADVQTGNAELVQRAVVPTSPSSPRPVRDAAVGAVLGLLIGIALALLIDMADRRLNDVEDIEGALGVPSFGSIPHSRKLSSRRGVVHEPGPAEFEAFGMIDAGLRYLDVDDPIRSVLITSAQPADGKTTVAWNLAFAAAARGARVLFVAADLRHVIDDGPLKTRKTGLSAVLAGKELADNLLAHRTAVTRGVTLPPSLDVLPPGRRPPNAPYLLGSSRMRWLLETAHAQYDLVVVDTPPIAAVSDAAPLVKLVDGVLVVARVGHTTRDGAKALRRELDKLGAHVLGVIVNGAGSPVSGYYDYGGASTYRAHAPADGAATSNGQGAEVAPGAPRPAARAASSTVSSAPVEPRD